LSEIAQAAEAITSIHIKLATVFFNIVETPISKVAAL
jgi:hypothetical protein